ncbi:MAG TPA: hypothetical protein VKL99_15195 [Candidatus Angelobacter sp.]|nr:hypothetical protein [Candidatus Angelobacter sp.]
MGWLSSILRALAPIAVEHGGQVLRDSLKARTAQNQPQPSASDVVQQLASDVEQLKAYALQLKSDLEILNAAIAAREERLRRWLLALVVWNIVMTVGLLVLAVLALRH